MGIPKTQQLLIKCRKAWYRCPDACRGILEQIATQQWCHVGAHTVRAENLVRKYSVIMWSSWAFTQLSRRVEVRIPRVHRILTLVHVMRPGDIR